MTTAWRLAQRPPWLVRLPDALGAGVAGAGVLVDALHVVTCAHVVALQACGSAYVDGDVADRSIVVEFPFADDTQSRAARVALWQPIGSDQSGDLAVLHLDEPVDATPAPLANPQSCHGHSFTAHGFPGGDPAARQVGGILGGASGPAGEWVQVDSGHGGWPIEHGFSGTPVFDEAAGAVVGIVAMRDAHRTGHVLPVSYLRKLWPELGDRVRWRLDLDPALKTHWLPRARGSEVESDAGDWYFVGRVAARQAGAAASGIPDPAGVGQRPDGGRPDHHRRAKGPARLGHGADADCERHGGAAAGVAATVNSPEGLPHREVTASR